MFHPVTRLAPLLVLLAIGSLPSASGQAIQESSRRHSVKGWPPPVRSNPLRSRDSDRDRGAVATRTNRRHNAPESPSITGDRQQVLSPTAYDQQSTRDQGRSGLVVRAGNSSESASTERDWVAIPTQASSHHSSGHGVVTVRGVNELGMPVYSHEIIRAPRITSMDGSHRGYDSGGSARRIAHLPHLIHHSPEQAPQAVIPDASHREIWKSPYSYGHFGASSARHWKLHFGYRDRDKEWRLR